MKRIADIHSHHLKSDAITDISDHKISLPAGFFGSAGVHPWYTHEKIDWEKLTRLIYQPQIVAIGECGLDLLRGADITTQQHIFEKHIEISETVGKPLIIHCVRAHQILLEMHRSINPRQDWIFHGFRLRPSIAASLLSEGINLSIGEHFNPESAAIIPDEKLFLETDESHLSINEIATNISHTINLAPDHIVNNSINNIKRVCKL